MTVAWVHTVLLLVSILIPVKVRGVVEEGAEVTVSFAGQQNSGKVGKNSGWSAIPFEDMVFDGREYRDRNGRAPYGCA